MRLPNPALKRFEYVAHQFPLPVLVKTVVVWLHAVGRDRLVGDLTALVDLRTRQQACSDEGICTPQGVAQKFVLPWLHGAVETEQVPGHTPYDRYVPWVASLLRREWGSLDRAARDAIVQAPPGFLPGLAAPGLGLRGLSHQAVQREAVLLVPSQHARFELHRAERRFQDTFNELRDGLRLLVEYATAHGHDLNRIRNLPTLSEYVGYATAWKEEEERRKIVEPAQGTVLYRFPDRWTVQLLDNEEALAYEGAAMSHCIADYADPHDELYSFYSLRDPGGRPHVTVEHDLTADAFTQVKGMANSEPKQEYMDRVVRWRLAELEPRYTRVPLAHWVEQDLEKDEKVAIMRALPQGPWGTRYLESLWRDKGDGELWGLYLDDVPNAGLVSWTDLENGGLRDCIDEAQDAAYEEELDKLGDEEAAETKAAKTWIRILGAVVQDGIALLDTERSLDDNDLRERPELGWHLWAAGYGEKPTAFVLREFGHQDELLELLLERRIMSPRRYRGGRPARAARS